MTGAWQQGVLWGPTYLNKKKKKTNTQTKKKKKKQKEKGLKSGRPHHDNKGTQLT